MKKTNKAAIFISEGNHFTLILLCLTVLILVCIFSDITPAKEIHKKAPKINSMQKIKHRDAINNYTFEIIGGEDKPVIDDSNPDYQGIKWGIETGRALKHDGEYHCFISERFDDPRSVKMRLGYWKSPDGINWKRVSTLFESSADQTGTDPRASFWSPMPFYNEQEGRWNLFYVAYRAKPEEYDSAGNRLAFYTNHRGTIWRAVSHVAGKAGLAGPYVDVGTILEPGPDSDYWEGLQGVDSFYLYPVGDEYYALYGSAQTHIQPCPWWGVGLAKASHMAGPWRRCYEMNPVNFGVDFVENPVVTILKQGLYAAVFDIHSKEGEIGYAFSRDGIHWSKAKAVNPSKKIKKWWTNLRTPLGLIHEKDDIYTVFFCAFRTREKEFIGSIKLKLVKK